MIHTTQNTVAKMYRAKPYDSLLELRRRLGSLTTSGVTGAARMNKYWQFVGIC